MSKMTQTNRKNSNKKKRKKILITAILGAIAIAVIILLFVLITNREIAVGKGIAEEDITEFFYTHASSTFPPHYQRYHFYVEDGKYRFYHEKREGSSWPLRESDITVSGSTELSDEEWAELFNYLNEGKVKKRGNNNESGGSSPWLYLYWNGDRSKYQEFSFSSHNTQTYFEEFCAALAAQNSGKP